MHFKTLRRAAVGLLAVGLALAGCAPTRTVHGYIPPAAEVAQLSPGVDTTATVEETLGLPSSTGLLREAAWFYVRSEFQNYAFYPARVVDRTVLVVNFDPNGVLTGVETYGVADGRIISLTSRTTETGGRQLGVLEQLFGNILNLDAEQFNTE